MTEQFTDALAAMGHDDVTFHANLLIRSRIDYVLLSDDWQPTDGGVVRTEASDHELIWAKLGPTTRPTSRSN